MLEGVSPDADTGVGETSGGFVDRWGGGIGVVTMSEQSMPPKPSRQTQVLTFEQIWKEMTVIYNLCKYGYL